MKNLQFNDSTHENTGAKIPTLATVKTKATVVFSATKSGMVLSIEYNAGEHAHHPKRPEDTAHEIPAAASLITHTTPRNFIKTDMARPC